MTDEQIARAAKIRPITEIAEYAGILADELEPYGRFKAKIHESLFERLNDNPDGKLILVTAINPTPAGEGKSTVSVGLNDALCRIGEKSVLALREPSLGPVFGVKGGAAGGGYAQVIPMDEINLHFTGDIHAITAANNLLAAMIDNHIYQGNTLGIDPRRVVWRRCLDMNDRQLRSVVSGLGGSSGGMPREDGFDITAASEIMAVFCLASSQDDLKTRLGHIVIGYTFDGKPVSANDLKAAGAMAALLKEAFKPNLVQTLEGNPAFIHGGPFANIAHGCNSVMATRLALKLGDYVVTEAGFGADLGAEKFLDIKCPSAGLKPSAAVIVATVRALKHHGGAKKDEPENLAALKEGIKNLKRHVENITKKFGLPAVVAINRFVSDTDAELRLIKESAAEFGVKAVVCDVWANGGAGGEELAIAVREAANSAENSYKPVYNDGLSLRDKIITIVKEIYGGTGVSFDSSAAKELRRLTTAGYGKLPVCIAKTQYSFSDDQKLIGAPEGFTIKVNGIRLSAGAGFVVVYTGTIMTMPGLPKIPAAENIDIADGEIKGLF